MKRLVELAPWKVDWIDPAAPPTAEPRPKQIFSAITILRLADRITGWTLDSWLGTRIELA